MGCSPSTYIFFCLMKLASNGNVCWSACVSAWSSSHVRSSVKKLAFLGVLQKTQKPVISLSIYCAVPQLLHIVIARTVPQQKLFHSSLQRKKSTVTYLNSTMHPGTRKRGEVYPDLSPCPVLLPPHCIGSPHVNLKSITRRTLQYFICPVNFHGGQRLWLLGINISSSIRQLNVSFQFHSQKKTPKQNPPNLLDIH